MLKILYIIYMYTYSITRTPVQCFGGGGGVFTQFTVCLKIGVHYN